VATHFIQLAKTVNHTMPTYVVNKLVAALNEKGRPLNGSRILVLGISYKPDIDDTRESPSIEVLEILCKKKARVEFYDPFVMEQQLLDGTAVTRARFDRASLQEFDVALILTNHSSIDYDLLSECVPLIVDTRGVFRNLQHNIIRA
jgi:UDP-N-acetyl-D-glucosamine dehydrogenase